MLKGLSFHTLAKAIFVICTYVIHLYLGKKLTPVEYGTIGVVISIITVNYNFLSNGARQAVSKLLASQKFDELDLIKKSFLTQMLVAVALTLLNFFSANFLSKILNAPAMAKYIQLSAIMIPFTAGYFICVGTINGIKQFVIEAIIVTIYPILRLTIIPYVEFLFSDSAVGTVCGFFTASFICCIGSALYIYKMRKRLIRRNDRVGIRMFISNMTNFLLFFTCITLILNVDMLYVNALVMDKDYVGYYTGAVNFAKVSYYLLSAVYIVVLPTITKYYYKSEMEKARLTIRMLNDVILIFIFPIVMIVGATTKEMLSLFYKPEYSVAATTATVLMCSQFLIGLFVVINMCISATKEKKYSTMLACVITVMDFLLCYIFTRYWGIVGAAMASFVAGLAGCIWSYVKERSIFGNPFDGAFFKLLIYNILLFGVVKLVFSLITITNIFVLFVFYGGIYFLFIGLMIWGKQIDINNIKNVFTQK